MLSKIKSVLTYGLLTALGLGLVLFGTSFMNNIHNLYLRYLSTWTVKLTNSAGNSGATGFVVTGKSGQKYVMTNAHVCQLAQNGLLHAHYRGDVFQVEVYKVYPFNDLCALKAHRELGLSVRVASGVTLGESTWAIGHPFLEPRSIAVGELSDSIFIQVVVAVDPEPGKCTGPTYSVEEVPVFFGIMIPVCVRTLEANTSSMIISLGNSGSPVVNLYGSVVGVAFAGNGTRSYHVPLSDLQDFVNQL